MLKIWSIQKLFVHSPCSTIKQQNIMCKVNKKMRKLHKEFVEKNGSEPRFADVVVKFDGEDEEFSTLIKINDYNPQDTENDPDDGNVIFYADGINELCQINTDRIADFIITDINGFGDTY